MSTQFENKAAWLKSKENSQLIVEDAPYEKPGEHELVVKAKAVAINPVDWAVQRYAIFPVPYPTVLGCDVSGEVVEVGSSVTKFKPGDRVLGCSRGYEYKGTFQSYVVTADELTSKIPDDWTFEQGSVLPLAVLTAGCLMYHYLKLDLPKVKPSTNNKLIMIWGASSSVGTVAVQFAKASGYEVIATCSPHNFDLIKKLGADHVFDYNSKTLENDLLAVVNGGRQQFAGVVECAGKGCSPVCFDVVKKAKVGDKVVASSGQIHIPVPDGIKAEFIIANVWRGTESIRQVSEYLQAAMAAGTFLPAPEPLVVGKGLEKIEEAFEVQFKGVSAKKVVVSL